MNLFLKVLIKTKWKILKNLLIILR
jgi:hypothetical protein